MEELTPEQFCEALEGLSSRKLLTTEQILAILERSFSQSVAFGGCIQKDLEDMLHAMYEENRGYDYTTFYRRLGVSGV